MNKTLFFFLSALAMLTFSIITICISPVINSNPNLQYDRSSNCKKLSDVYKNLKDNNEPKLTLDHQKQELNICNRQKAMIGLEYASLILDIVLLLFAVY